MCCLLKPIPPAIHQLYIICGVVIVHADVMETCNRLVINIVQSLTINDHSDVAAVAVQVGEQDVRRPAGEGDPTPMAGPEGVLAAEALT